jgi:cullin-associated NEDD8-dissociated protein 1
MDALVNPLEKSMTNKTKPDVVKQEVHHNEDMIRSALHAINSLNWIQYVTLKLTFFSLILMKVFA